jgi:DNA-binding NarL/FixJ family response regulator
MRGRRRQKRVPRASRHIRVLIVDDNELMREGLRKVLGEQSDVKIVGEASNGETAVALSRKTRPDIVLMDVNMPGMDGIEATRQIASRSGAPAVIGFSIHDDKEIEAAILRAGALSYVTKQESPEKLYSAIRDSAKTRVKYIARRNSNH